MTILFKRQIDGLVISFSHIAKGGLGVAARQIIKHKVNHGGGLSFTTAKAVLKKPLLKKRPYMTEKKRENLKYGKQGSYAKKG